MEATGNSENKEGDSKGNAMTSTKLTTKDSKGLTNQTCSQRRFLDFLKASPSKLWLLKCRFNNRLKHYSDPKPPLHDANTTTIDPCHRHFKVPFIHSISWRELAQYGKNWIKHPLNMAFSAWLFCVVIDIGFLGLLMTGLLDHAIPDILERKMWNETMNQVLNALFTIMCIYQHPRIIHHLIILFRWNPSDIEELRMAYCNTSAMKPYERPHIAFIVTFLHITCFAQYILCALYWGWSSKTRPHTAENLCIVLGTAAPVIVWLYTMYSPLSKKITCEENERKTEPINDEEAQKQEHQSRIKVIVTKPEWQGEVFDCWDDVTVAHLSFLCMFCMFGWNMERLGFGNMYVHIVTFILFCTAPLIVFNMSTLHIDDHAMEDTLRISAFLLCFCGLLYGGFWRIQMRKKFKLPPNPLCCSHPSMTDCFQWLFCCACSLAQEVRTRNFYGVEEDRFYTRKLEEGVQKELETWPEEGQVAEKDEIMSAPTPETIYGEEKPSTEEMM